MSAGDAALAAVKAQTIEVDRVVKKYGVGVPWTVEVPISVNARTVEIGQNGHAWGSGLAGRWTQVGCKRALLSIGVNHWTGSWPGTDPLVQTIDRMCRELSTAGVKVTLGLINYPNSAWSAYVTGAVTALRGVVDEFNINNEPNDMTMTYQAMQLSYPLVKAANPNAKVLGPCTTGDAVNGFNHMKAFIAMNPWSYIDMWNWHTYYDTPEGNYINALVPAAAMVKKPLYIGEVGWMARDNQAEDPANVVYGTPKVSDYHSFYSFLAAATPGMAAVLHYALVDESPTQWGVFVSGWTEKPYAAIFRECNTHIHAATGFAAYSRGGRDKLTSRWFVRCDTPSGQRLVVRHPTVSVTEKIWCVGSSLVAKVLGGASTTTAIPGGKAQMSVPIGTRATVLSGCAFPEFT